MSVRLVRLAILILAGFLTIGALGVFLFLSDIDPADQIGSIVSATLALFTSVFAVAIARLKPAPASHASSLELRTEDDFLAAWEILEQHLHEVVPLDPPSTGAIPLKLLLAKYSEQPGVTESDMRDFLMLLSIRNGIMHPTLNKAGAGSQSHNQEVSAAILRQLAKLDELKRKR